MPKFRSDHFVRNLSSSQVHQKGKLLGETGNAHVNPALRGMYFFNRFVSLNFSLATAAYKGGVKCGVYYSGVRLIKDSRVPRVSAGDYDFRFL